MCFVVVMALGNGSAANGGVAQEKAPVVNGTNVETLPRSGKQVNKFVGFGFGIRGRGLLLWKVWFV